MALDGDAQSDTSSALLGVAGPDGVAQPDTPSAFFGTATPYSHEEWLYNGWTREDVSDPPRPDPPGLRRLALEREQMEAEDEYSRLLMAQSAAMLKLMLGRKREIVLLVHGTVAEVLEGLWVVLDERSRETAERNRMRAADVASRVRPLAPWPQPLGGI